jgi:hypothetical protein
MNRTTPTTGLMLNPIAPQESLHYRLVLDAAASDNLRQTIGPPSDYIRIDIHIKLEVLQRNRNKI